jgi:hypothetical protein
MIHILPFLQVLRINLLIMLDFVMQKASTGVKPHYLGGCVPAHLGVEDATEKLVSTNFYSSLYPLLYLYLC